MHDADVTRLSLAELAARLTEQVTRLARAELALARAELFARGRQAVMGGGLFAAAVVIGLSGWLALVAAAVAGIAEALPAWASALIVGAALTAVAAVLALAGRAKVRRGMPPLAMTTASVRSDLHELTGQAGPSSHFGPNGYSGPNGHRGPDEHSEAAGRQGLSGRTERR